MEYSPMLEAEFKKVFTSEKLRNEVAFAHGCYDKDYNFKYFGTCTYPNENRRSVTPEQIQICKDLKVKRAEEVLKENKNKLLFVGMGMNYKARYDDDVCNHRIRTEFVNKHGNIYFVEVSSGLDDKMIIDFSIDRNQKEDVYNYKNLERENLGFKYTKENVLKFVNRFFDCNFKELVVDYYNINCSGVICESPKN